MFWVSLMTFFGCGDWLAAIGFLLQGQSLFFDFVAEITVPPPTRKRRERHRWFSKDKRYSGKKWRSIQRALAMYAAEKNKHRYKVSRRFYVDRAAASKRRLRLFKQWYYFIRSPTSPCTPRKRAAFYSEFVAAKDRHHLQIIAGGFDPHHAEWLAKKLEAKKKKEREELERKNREPREAYKRKRREEQELWSDSGWDSVDESRFKLKTFSPLATSACAVDFVLRKYGDFDDDDPDVDDVPISTAVSTDGFDSVDEYGHFKLYKHDSAELDEFIQEHLPNPSRLLTWNGTTPLQHTHNVTTILERLRPHYNLLRFSNASIPRSDLRVVDGDLDTKRDERYYQTPVVFDSGASFGLTPFYEDFITYEETNIEVKGIGSQNVVVGYGTVLYRCKATDGSTCFIPGLAYHLPTTDVRLFSPQAYFQHYGGDATINSEEVCIHLKKSVTDRNSTHTIKLPIDLGCNLPLFRDAACTAFEQKTVGRHFRTFVAVQQQLEGDFLGTWNCSLSGEDSDNFFGEQFGFSPYQAFSFPAAVTVPENQNLDAAQKELLSWHLKLGAGFRRIQQLMKGHSKVNEDGTTMWHPPVIPVKKASAATVAIPKCGTCGIASAQAKGPTTDRVSTTDPSKANVMTKEKLLPGELVSMDSIGISIPGRPFHGRGGDPSQFYKGATIFHDAATNIIKVYPQLSLGASDTLLSKAKFEQFLFEKCQRKVLHYHSDQGIFVSKAFEADCDSKNQKQTFSSVGAKWQNGLAESSVKSVFWRARHFMLHAALHWSTHNADDPSYWPQAVEHSTWIHNRLPSATHGFSPLELLTRVKSDHSDLLRAHVWGSPVYVLDARLQDKQKVPKFAHRAHLGQFMGFDTESTSSTAALVRHLGTQNLSTQLHCIFDDNFETVFGLLGSASEKLCDNVGLIWDRLFDEEGARDWYVDPNLDHLGTGLEYSINPMEDYWLSPDELRARRNQDIDPAVDDDEPLIKFEKELVPHTIQADPHVRFDDAADVIDFEADGTMGTVDATDSTPAAPTTGAGGMSSGRFDSSAVDGSVDSAAGSLPSGSSAPASTSTSRPQRDRKPTWKLRDTVLNVTKTLTSALSTTPEGVSPVPNLDSTITPDPKHNIESVLHSKSHRASNSRHRPTITHSSWHHALSFTPAQLATLKSAEKNVLRNERHRSDFSKYSLTLHNKSEPIGVQQAYSATPHGLTSSKERRRLSARTVRSMLFEVDTIEDLMQSPLSNIITLAVNECVYSGPQLTPICQDISPHFLSAKTGLSKEDNPGWKEAMAGDEAQQYWEAAKTEIATLEKMEAWDVVPISSVPKGQPILGTLWTFKRKRLPSGVIKKYKARLTARGDMQVEGVDFNEVWAPVCSWTTVRLMFTLQMTLGLASASADVSCAFLHAPIDDEEVYLRMPKGFEQDGMCLKLKRSLYGLRQSPRNFFLFLSEKMNDCGMKQSEHDPCLFIGPKVIAVAYVDDLLFWAKDENDITDLMIQLRENGLDLEKEDDCAGFLGVDVKVLEADENGRATKLELTQAGLIDRVIENLGLNSANGKYTPAKCEPLTKDVDGDPCQEDFNVAAVVGQLLYLAGHTRPDIAYAVNCVARYMFCPKRSHELALKQIGKYLKATRGKGMIITPSDNILSIEAFPDADFGGLYGHESGDDPACVKSRTGFVILAANCPILWKSQLQSKTALSTMEAEISALAHCCKELFPLIDLAKSLAQHFDLDPVKSTMSVTIHEDNAAALILGNTLPPGYTPRSKFFHLETIWFREEIAKRGINLVKVDTKEQLGDMFTKGLVQVTFEHLRKKLMGW